MQVDSRTPQTLSLENLATELFCDEASKAKPNLHPLLAVDAAADQEIEVAPEWQDLAIRLDSWVMRGNASQLAKIRVIYFASHPELEGLNLTGCNLSMLPPIFDYPELLARIKILSVAENPIRVLPSKIASLGNLFALDVSATRLTRLPREVDQHPSLKRLWIGQTRISYLSIEMEKRTDIKIYANYVDHPINEKGNLVLRRIVAAMARPESPDRKRCLPHKERTIRVTDCRRNKRPALGIRPQVSPADSDALLGF